MDLLKKEFSSTFSNVVNVSLVVVCSAQSLEVLIGDSKNILIKTDVEGYEPELIAALEKIITKYRPDLLVEVELWLILGDGVNQAADSASGATSSPSRNVTPLMTFGNWF